MAVARAQAAGTAPSGLEAVLVALPTATLGAATWLGIALFAVAVGATLLDRAAAWAAGRR
ncbi:MAG: hypothetical protein ABEJ23_02935 [Haloarculaceae archaeon]